MPRKGETHLHTLHGDGQDTPAATLEARRRAVYDFAAIAGHNTVGGHAEARSALESVRRSRFLDALSPARIATDPSGRRGE